jgi:hypothetical protein
LRGHPELPLIDFIDSSADRETADPRRRHVEPGPSRSTIEKRTK